MKTIHKSQFKKYASINIFLELDFYVPKIDRKNRGLKANPYKDGHFLIGGTFFKSYPILKNTLSEKKDFWIWDYENNEKALLMDIYTFFSESWELLQEKESPNDVAVCGIGISRLDLPYLLARCIHHKIDNEANLFNIIQRLRIIDLENVTIPHFNTDDNYIYSKTKGEIYSLFLDSVPKSSIAVWERYDKGEYKKIKKNNENNLNDLLNIYKLLLKCGIVQRMRSIYKNETFIKLFELINNSEDKQIIEDYFLYNETEEKWCLNEYLLDMSIQKNFIQNINMKLEIKRIMENAYKIYRKNNGEL